MSPYFHIFLTLVVSCLSSYSSLAFCDDWVRAGDDLEILERSYPENALLGTPMVFIRSSLKRYRVEVVRAREFGWKRATIKALTIKAHGAVGINANFFDEDGKALGLVLSRGTLFQGLHLGGSVLTGVFQIQSENLSIVARAKFKSDGISEAVQAGPRLLINGVRVAELREHESSSRRAGLCIDGRGNLILYSVASSFSGMTMKALQDALLSPEINCKNALNLDGGGSAQLYVSNTLVGGTSSAESIYIFGKDEIPVGLVLVPK